MPGGSRRLPKPVRAKPADQAISRKPGNHLLFFIRFNNSLESGECLTLIEINESDALRRTGHVANF
jgi:hypothetical protein